MRPGGRRRLLSTGELESPFYNRGTVHNRGTAEPEQIGHLLKGSDETVPRSESKLNITAQICHELAVQSVRGCSMLERTARRRCSCVWSRLYRMSVPTSTTSNCSCNQPIRSQRTATTAVIKQPRACLWHKREPQRSRRILAARARRHSNLS